MSDVWWTSSWVLVRRCVKSQNVPKTILLCINKQSFQHILCQCTLIANIVFGTFYDFTHLPTKTQLLVHHISDVDIFQPKLPILFLTFDHAQANTLSMGAITKRVGTITKKVIETLTSAIFIYCF